MKTTTVLALILAATTSMSLLSFPAFACEECDKAGHAQDEKHDEVHDNHKDQDEHDGPDHSDPDHVNKEKSEATQ